MNSRLLLLLALMLHSVDSALIINPANGVVNAATIYEVSLTTDNPLDTGGYTILTFPAAYYSAATITGSSCSIACVKSGTTYNISNTLYVGSTLLFNITNLVNPGSVVYPQVDYIIYSSTNAQTDSLSTTITLFPGSLTSKTSFM